MLHERNRSDLFAEASDGASLLPRFDIPKNNLVLEWIYGYNSEKMRKNVFYTDQKDSIVYPAASIGVCLNKKTFVQYFYQEHKSDEITAMTIHPNRRYIATGTIGKYPKICIWDSKVCIVYISSKVL